MALYHYTDLHAVYSILKNKVIWLTDIRFLNDSQELHDGMSVLSEALNSPHPDLWVNYDYYENSKKYLLSYLTGFNSYSPSEDPLFVFSLSSELDCLSQWRGYGSYVIEFDENELASQISSIEKCIYEPVKKLDMARRKARDAINKVSHDMGKNNGGIGVDTIDAASSLILSAATFKNKGFAEEKESRIILSKNEFSPPSNISYRPRRDILVPYVEIPIDLNCIKSIMIGPIKNQDMSYFSMSEFVSTIESEWKLESGNIEYEITVSKSIIPYRS